MQENLKKFENLKIAVAQSWLFPVTPVSRTGRNGSNSRYNRLIESKNCKKHLNAVKIVNNVNGEFGE